MSIDSTLWQKKYAESYKRLESMDRIEGVLSVFNANIDAVKAVDLHEWNKWLTSSGIGEEAIDKAPQSIITTMASFFKGFLECFSKGIAQEWLIGSEELFKTIQEMVGYDKLQMGGQGGIIANVLSLCQIEKVFVHAASLPQLQADLFLKRDNLLSANADDQFVQASEALRKDELPLIHWILEFQKGDTITCNGVTYTCPKSNRFIATWDPLNFKLAIDKHFLAAMENYSGPVDYCLLAGYQMLTEPLTGGAQALDRITESKAIVDRWRVQHPRMKVHFEFASTQDVAVRKELLDEMGDWADSIGLNEQELIDLLEIAGCEDLANECKENTHSVALFKGLAALFEKIGASRIQLHHFGQYITLLKNSTTDEAIKSAQGMMLAASVAASKAGNGALEECEDLQWAQGMSIGEVSMEEFGALGEYLSGLDNIDARQFSETGIAIADGFTIVAVPTIIVDKPKTLVGMGDTISSLSLVGADPRL